MPEEYNGLAPRYRVVIDPDHEVYGHLFIEDGNKVLIKKDLTAILTEDYADDEEAQKLVAKTEDGKVMLKAGSEIPVIIEARYGALLSKKLHATVTIKVAEEPFKITVTPISEVPSEKIEGLSAGDQAVIKDALKKDHGAFDVTTNRPFTGKISVGLPVTKDHVKAVYHIREDKTVEKFDKPAVKDHKVVLEVSELSPFIVVYAKTDGDKDDTTPGAVTDNNATGNNAPNNGKALNNSGSTGVKSPVTGDPIDMTTLTLMFAIMLFAAMIGSFMLVLKRRE